ncbi:DNA-directed RNA polymerase subunit alpha [Candidatus Nomurabacteria bacterium RIFCSPHIGHO2_01_FULL_39_220]|uniref:DNA-directed RNA polymerase subunit alpha n=1 Tax=Candidatus Nomurabacteria bacterium RIFCSPLOWO2_02_FULL_40_67 TaxID=1801787 RepID=A0A1F6Y779_9BACT|nr:MAG: DNA-directed RNA polymerase subunit alpha [Candidatus Nomurabacteria bacterium RBG_16_40_11]OGI70696.1 MAG: DNA-directed RNA polymerase subunit alpha [Candidatus Nomurabacteria bacterium RIFCSPHIGHO2_01_FULL_39_220]OGI71958.1 MAG: DNA-directed RNA polymerase subunit alpha [Candidatus Nomurabacteria bacterium RIFCSPHIGHO2_02_41_18]OGI79067.1 MAG: DNA-directed RNA polymerase subunit alpha [Candidatus Nomurabacteria bacterium RIFCSPHIGHO2_02_FULL_41_150]OGI82035.1 MAG: DNA-directed RNA pol
MVMPSKPRVVLEEANKGVFEIDGLYPGYGHTLGNSLRRIILSSLPGASVTSIKIDGVSHEFQTLEGIKEDVIVMILNLKKTRFKMISDEPQTVSLSVKGPKAVTAGDIKTGGQVEILNPELHIVEVTGKINLNIEMKIEKGLGFIPKELFQKEKVDVGTIAVDAIFTPVRWVSYEVENMRVGDKTNHNRLRISIETDGTLSAREALSRSIEIMINQLKAIIDFKEPEEEKVKKDKDVEDKKPARHASQGDAGGGPDFADVLKTRTDSLDLSTRTLNALTGANIRTLGGLARKKREDLLEVEGIGEKGISEIKKVLAKFGLNLKE